MTRNNNKCGREYKVFGGENNENCEQKKKKRRNKAMWTVWTTILHVVRFKKRIDLFWRSTNGPMIMYYGWSGKQPMHICYFWQVACIWMVADKFRSFFISIPCRSRAGYLLQYLGNVAFSCTHTKMAYSINAQCKRLVWLVLFTESINTQASHVYPCVSP